MPTKKRRINIIPDNLPAVTTPEETCPSLFTGQKLAEKDPEKYARIVQSLAKETSLADRQKREGHSGNCLSYSEEREQKRGCGANLDRWSYELCFPKLV